MCFLSGKGITYFYETLSGKTNLELSSEKILLTRGDKYSLQTIDELTGHDIRVHIQHKVYMVCFTAKLF